MGDCMGVVFRELLYIYLADIMLWADGSLDYIKIFRLGDGFCSRILIGMLCTATRR